MEAQQFHLKWNNHSLNTLSSFQHLLDTHCLVDVSLVHFVALVSAKTRATK